jgi:hypothetical protein
VSHEVKPVADLSPEQRGGSRAYGAVFFDHLAEAAYQFAGIASLPQFPPTPVSTRGIDASLLALIMFETLDKQLRRRRATLRPAFQPRQPWCSKGALECAGMSMCAGGTLRSKHCEYHP